MNIVLDTHSHTIASGHGFSTIKELVEEAAEKGLELISITDHSVKLPGSSDVLYFVNLKSLPKELMGIGLLTGVELNIMNDKGEIDMEENLLKKLDVVIASLHPPCIKPMDIEKNTNAVINTMNNPYVKIIGHLGDPRYPIDIDKITTWAKKTGTAIEVNEKSSNPNSGVRVGGVDNVFNIVKECVKKGVNITLGSDAHFYPEIGRLEYATDMVKRAGASDEQVLNTSVERFKAFLKTPKTV